MGSILIETRRRNRTNRETLINNINNRVSSWCGKYFTSNNKKECLQQKYKLTTNNNNNNKKTPKKLNVEQGLKLPAAIEIKLFFKNI